MKKQNKKIKAHFKKMMQLNSKLMELEDLNEIEIRYKHVIGMVQTLILDNRLISLSDLIQNSYPEYGKHLE